MYHVGNGQSWNGRDLFRDLFELKSEDLKSELQALRVHLNSSFGKREKERRRSPCSCQIQITKAYCRTIRLLKALLRHSFLQLPPIEN